MTDHAVDGVQLYLIGPCACSAGDLADEDLHPEDAYGYGTYCLLTPTSTACRECSDMADEWVDHREGSDDEEELE